METREEVLQNLQLSKRIFQRIESLMNWKGRIDEKEEKIKTAADQIIMNDDLPGDDAIVKILLIVFAVCVFCMFASGKILLFIGIFVGVFLFFGIIYSVRHTNGEEERKREREKQAELYYNERFAPLKQEYATVEKEIKGLFQSEEWEFVQSYIPKNYVDTEAIDFFINAVTNKRADTLKEAINLYEDYLYQLRMEELQQNQMLMQQATLEAAQEQLAATMEQNAKLANIEKKSIQTARAAKATAFISAYSAYNTRKIAKK